MVLCFVWALGADPIKKGCVPQILVGTQPHRGSAHRRATFIRQFMVGPRLSLRVCAWAEKTNCDLFVHSKRQMLLWEVVMPFPWVFLPCKGSHSKPVCLLVLDEMLILLRACKQSKQGCKAWLCSSSPVAQCLNN